MKNDQLSFSHEIPGAVPDLLMKQHALLSELSRQRKMWLLAACADIYELRERNDDIKRQLTRLTALLKRVDQLNNTYGSRRSRQ